MQSKPIRICQTQSKAINNQSTKKYKQTSEANAIISKQTYQIQSKAGKRNQQSSNNTDKGDQQAIKINQKQSKAIKIKQRQSIRNQEAIKKQTRSNQQSIVSS